MDIFTITNQGIEKSATLELNAIKATIKKTDTNVIEANLENNQILSYLKSCQAPRRVLAAIDKSEDHTKLELNNFNLKDFFTNEKSFKIEVEGVKGQDNRVAIAKNFATKLFNKLKEQNINPQLELKNPDFLVIIYFNQNKYFLGIDLLNEINLREYRVFPHPASFKGDFAFNILINSKFKKEDKLLSAMFKDGVIAIEAATYANNIQLNNLDNLNNFPIFQNQKTNPPPSGKKQTTIYGFDTSNQNLTSAKKNASIAGVKELVDLKKYSFDDLDVRFNKDFFDNVIFHITKKDEDQINEIFYQVSYILKSGGIFSIITRSTLDLSLSSKFALLEKIELVRGDSKLTQWVAKKN
jgi:23S rRNA G2445 N2-methylase RlmL